LAPDRVADLPDRADCLGSPPAGDYDALFVTSANAVRQAGKAVTPYAVMPAYAVGDATARALKAAGFTDIRTGRGDAAMMLEAAAENGVTRALHLAGEDYRDGDHSSITLDRRILYRSAHDRKIRPGALNALTAGGLTVLLHSGRAAEYFARLCDAAGIAPHQCPDRRAVPRHRGKRGRRLAQGIASPANPTTRPYWRRPPPCGNRLIRLAVATRTTPPMPIDAADPYAPRRRSILPTLLLIVVAILIGMGVMAWLFYRYDQPLRMSCIRRSLPVIVPPSPERRPALVNIAPPPAADIVQTIVDQRIDRIEEKVDDIDERTATATSEAHRAERLLIAFAARRAIDRGAPLGYLEGVLRERFGRTEPQAVATVISTGRQPVTIAELRDGLEALGPRLSSAADNAGWWESVRRELADLVVIRRADVVSNAPVDRFTRAREDLAAGHVDAALVEVARLPNRRIATTWITEARRYVQARVALDRIESAALLEPAPVVAPGPN
jgi:hypothetical protein